MLKAMLNIFYSKGYFTTTKCLINIAVLKMYFPVALNRFYFSKRRISAIRRNEHFIKDVA